MVSTPTQTTFNYQFLEVPKSLPTIHVSGTAFRTEMGLEVVGMYCKVLAERAVPYQPSNFKDLEVPVTQKVQMERVGTPTFKGARLTAAARRLGDAFRSRDSIPDGYGARRRTQRPLVGSYG